MKKFYVSFQSALRAIKNFRKKNPTAPWLEIKIELNKFVVEFLNNK